MKTDYTFLRHPSIIIIVGGRGSGKSAEAHALLEMFAQKGLICYYYAPITITGNPTKYFAGGQPEWLKFYGRSLPPNAVYFVDDAQLMMHAREWYRNIAIDKLMTMSRHRKTTVIYTTQQTVRIDKNLVAEVDAIIFKRPSLMAAHTERPFIKRLVKLVNKKFDEYEEKHPEQDMRAMSYCISNKPRYVGMIGPTPLPAYWTEELSTW